MTERETPIQCFRSGQMSAAQFERHCEDDPALRSMAAVTKTSDPVIVPGSHYRELLAQLAAMQAQRDEARKFSDRNFNDAKEASEALVAEQTAHAETRAKVAELTKLANLYLGWQNEAADERDKAIEELSFITKLCRSEQEQLAQTTINLSDSERDLAAARQALEPFAAEADRPDWQDRPDSDCIFVPLGALRRARAALIRS